ncbi:hypothetical protein [Methylobacterium sp. CM6257]|jgi:hypothetical protein
MERKTKTLAELEEMLLAGLRELPNGELIEGVNIVPPSPDEAALGVGVFWNETGTNMRPIVSYAITYSRMLFRRFDVKTEE